MTTLKVLVASFILFGCATAKVVTAPAAPVGIKQGDKVALSSDTNRAPKNVASYPEGRLGNVFMACASHGLPETTCLCSVWELAERYTFDEVVSMSDQVRGETYVALLKACYDAENGVKGI